VDANFRDISRNFASHSLTVSEKATDCTILNVNKLRFFISNIFCQFSLSVAKNLIILRVNNQLSCC